MSTEAAVDEVADLRAEVAAQQVRIERLCAQVESQQDRISELTRIVGLRRTGEGVSQEAVAPGMESGAAPPRCRPGPTWSRRALLLGGVGAAAGAAAAASGVATAPPARAWTGPMTYGITNNSGVDQTALTSTNSFSTLLVVNSGNGGGGALNGAVQA